jgi:hypothetical protein
MAMVRATMSLWCAIHNVKCHSMTHEFNCVACIRLANRPVRAAKRRKFGGIAPHHAGIRASDGECCAELTPCSATASDTCRFQMHGSAAVET